MHFLRAVSAARFFIRQKGVLKVEEKESNFVAAVKLMNEMWFAELEKKQEEIEHTAFLCGSADDSFLKETDSLKIVETVKSILQNNDIKRIIYCNRNSFDKMVINALLGDSFKDIEIILVSDKHDISNRFDSEISPRIKLMMPYKQRIKKKQLYRTLYDYALYNCKYMITGSKDDNDISVYVNEKAEQMNHTVIDFFDYI